MSRYKAVTGFCPDHPPGRIGVKDALELLTAELFAREKARRELVRLNNERSAELIVRDATRS